MVNDELRKLTPVFYTCGPGKQEALYEAEGACRVFYDMDNPEDKRAFWADVARSTGQQHLTPEEMEAKAYRDAM